jgi:hypothetical protein
MDAINTVREYLAPRLNALIRHYIEQNEVNATQFFTGILARLNTIEYEEQLLELFIELSTTAFHGFLFDDTSWAMTDEILAYSIEISETFTASAQHPH